MGRIIVESPVHEEELAPADPCTEELMDDEEAQRKAEKKARKEAKRLAKKRAAEEAGEAVEGAADAEPVENAPKRQCRSGDDAQRRAFLEANRVTLEGNESDSFYPFYTFAEANWPAITAKGTAEYTKPTPIQAVCWPIILAGRDLIGLAETGSGKTLGFALPAMAHLAAVPLPKNCIRVVALGPTRELVQQSGAVFKKISAAVAVIHGQVSKYTQLDEMRHSNIVVATPGRLIDFLDSEQVDVSAVSFVVLDEADRMLDIGFAPDIRKILNHIPAANRQTVMFSATWPDKVQELATEFMRDPVRVNVGATELTANVRIAQSVEELNPVQKMRRLLDIIAEKDRMGHRAIVFVLYKHEGPTVSEQLIAKFGPKVGLLTGDCSQNKRDNCIRDFRAGKLQFLVATDVASRGLDIDDIECVVNFSMPLTIEDYVHRIGRTARAGRSGKAIAFFNHNADKLLGWRLAKVLEQAGQDVPDFLRRYGPPVIKTKNNDATPAFKLSSATPSAKIVFDDDE